MQTQRWSSSNFQLVRSWRQIAFLFLSKSLFVSTYFFFFQSSKRWCEWRRVKVGERRGKRRRNQYILLLRCHPPSTVCLVHLCPGHDHPLIIIQATQPCLVTTLQLITLWRQWWNSSAVAKRTVTQNLLVRVWEPLHRRTSTMEPRRR